MSKTILITGSTDGIGKLTALKLAKAGHKIILHGRDAHKLDTVIAELSKKTGNATIKGCVADLSDLSAIKNMAVALRADHPTIDVLINNAGVFLTSKPRDDKGMDLRFVVNYLAPVLLTEELLPFLNAEGGSRVINLSSAAQAPVSLAALRGEQALGDQAAYAQSKLALTMWSFAMAKKHEDLNFIAVNPGSLLNTKMVQEAYGKHWSAADKGADILVELATSSTHAEMSGKYFDNDRGSYGRAHEDAYDQKAVDELVETTNLLLEIN